MVSIKKLVYSLAVMMVALVAFSSCNKNEEPMMVQNGQSNNNQEFIAPSTRATASNGAFGWTYYPDPNASYASSPAASTYPGFGGQYIGGYFRASLVDNYGSYSVKIERIDGEPFTQAGTAHIKRGSLYASSMGSAQIRVGDRSVYIPVSISLNSNNTSRRGVLNIWPMIISGNARFFSYPIMIWTDPMFTPRSENGQIMGYVDNIPIYKAVHPEGGLSTYQCVEFCKRYYNNVYGMSIGSVYSATNWYNNASDFGFTAYANGTKEPRVGDAVCWGGGDGNTGHIGVIIEVDSYYVKVAHQNGADKPAIGMRMDRLNSTTLANPLNSRPLLGIMRKS